MKHRHFFAALFTVALVAMPALASTSLLTPDGIRYAIERSPDLPQIEITRAEGGLRSRLVVPSTDDATPEKAVQIAYDTYTDTLHVVWTRDNSFGAEIRYATLSAAGEWSSPRNIAAGAQVYGGLQLAITRSEHADTIATLMHVAWWSVNGDLRDPEYALFAFENGAQVSASVVNLEEMAALGDGVSANDFDSEDIGEPVHPPLTMERKGEGVEFAFGSVSSTEITRLTVVPRKVGPTVRIWKPVGRNIVRTPKSNLISGDTTPVQAFIRNGRVALYTLGEQFRYVVLRSNNTWTTARSVDVDEDNTSTDLVRDLRAAVEEIGDDEDAATVGVGDETPDMR
ncbi:MAG TPA: hypothetical protein VGD79_12155 [Thermoanaerobaculia bacterium]|jgi:hypothetical protein